MAIKLSSIDQFEQVLEENKYVFVLKQMKLVQFLQMRMINLINFYMKEILMVTI